MEERERNLTAANSNLLAKERRGGFGMAAAIAMAVVAVMAGWRKMAGFAWFLSAVGVGPTRPNPTRLCIQLNVVPRRTSPHLCVLPSPLRPSLTPPHPAAAATGDTRTVRAPNRRHPRHPYTKTKAIFARAPATQPPATATPLLSVS